MTRCLIRLVTVLVLLQVSNSFATQSDIGCEDSSRIFLWAQQRYGGKSSIDPASRSFAHKAAETLLEKLDPNRVLWLQSDVDQFQKVVASNWEFIWKKQQCQLATGWLLQALPRVRKAIEGRIKERVAAGLRLGGAKSNSSWQKPTTWAKNATNLVNRQNELINSVAEGIPDGLLAWYDGDHTRALSAGLQEFLPQENWLPNTYFAKALLGAMDPYSTYFSNSEFGDFYSELSGGTSGVGVVVRSVPQGYFIEKILSDSPAGRSKEIQAKAVITQIDGKNLKGLSDEDARDLFIGPEGSKAKITFLTSPGGKAKTVEIVRQSFSFDEGRISSRWENRGGKILVIEIPSFYGRAGRNPELEDRSSAEDLRAVLLAALKQKKPDAVVLDLRGNPGGFLEEAVQMASYFLGNRAVVAVQDNTNRRVMHEEMAQALYHGPLLVVTDTETASASEVLAGALKDHGRAVVVGDATTFGKGSVQKLFHLEDEFWQNDLPKSAATGVVKITTSVFYGPSGHSPANGGVTPHLALSNSSSKAKKQSVAEGEPLQLAKPILLPNQIDLLRAASQSRTRALMQKELQQKEDDKALMDEALRVAADFARLQQRDKNVSSRAE